MRVKNLFMFYGLVMFSTSETLFLHSVFDCGCFGFIYVHRVDGVTMHAHTLLFYFSRVLSLLYRRKTNVALSLTQTVQNSGPRDSFVENRGFLNQLHLDFVFAFFYFTFTDSVNFLPLNLSLVQKFVWLKVFNKTLGQ